MSDNPTLETATLDPHPEEMDDLLPEDAPYRADRAMIVRRSACDPESLAFPPYWPSGSLPLEEAAEKWQKAASRDACPAEIEVMGGKALGYEFSAPMARLTRVDDGESVVVDAGRLRRLCLWTEADGVRVAGPKDPVQVTKGGEVVALLKPMRTPEEAREMYGKMADA